MSAAPANPFLSETAQINAEHISLQSETVEFRAKPAVERKSLVKYRLRSRARGTVTRVTILEDGYASVQVKRSRIAAQEHQVDLRFVDPRPVGIRKVSWRWLWIAIGMTVLAAAALVFTFVFASPIALPWSVPIAIVLSTLAVSSYLVCLYFTTETLLLVSVHGRARVICITGGLGTCRAARQCAVDIVKHINLMRKQSKQSRLHFLRE